MKYISLLLLTLTLIGLSACKDENTYLNGNIIGFVELYDENGKPETLSNNVEISIDKTNHVTYSNDLGRYELNDVDAGTYNIHLTKEGYASVALNGYQFVGGNLPILLLNRSMFKLPEVEIKTIDVNYFDERVYLNGSITTNSHYSITTYLSKEEEVSEEKYDQKVNAYDSNWEENSESSFDYNFILNNELFSPGETIYVKLYFENPYNYNYSDNITGATSSKLMSFVY